MVCFGAICPAKTLLLSYVSNCKSYIFRKVGGSTSVLGDPSGRTRKRDYQSLEQYISNSNNLEQNLKQIIDNYWTQVVPAISVSGKLGSVEVVNNADWLTNDKMMDISRNVLPHFKLSELLEKESVKLRMDSGNTMDLGEFFYPILQALDFLYLHENYDCYAQVGGHDQIGNITCGLNLIYRKLGRRVFGLTVPLITTPDGQKLGKSVSISDCGMDTIWLMGRKLKPYHFYQKILNLPDGIISDKLLRQLTFFAPDEINQLLTNHEVSYLLYTFLESLLLVNKILEFIIQTFIFEILLIVLHVPFSGLIKRK
ncbi:Tyrosine--tRNA ligase, mitochondrial [Schistosoma japonicum]|nr:Tyrosine--tRNA ligase, mitochondrial [Schistosoma japonicum]